MPSSYFTKKILVSLYSDQHLSTQKIAKQCNCDSKTVYYWLNQFNIKTRHRKRVYIRAQLLHRLYSSKLSMAAIGLKFNLSASAVFRKLKTANICSRSSWETNTKHPRSNFSGNKIEKAYLIGFRIGDLYVHQKTKNSSIQVKSSTTKIDQVHLLKKLFSSYGPVWISNSKNASQVFSFSSLLNNSFHFLLKKDTHIPKWIIRKKDYFFAFVGGYTDAEGSMGVYSKRARFRIGTYDKELLKEIHKRLLTLHIVNTFNMEAKAGLHSGVIHNGDFYRVNISDSPSLYVFLKLVIPYLQHKNRQKQAFLALNNIHLRI